MPSPDRALTGRTILAIFAHPDDESLACGGTLARAADAGARVVVVSVSRGEAGSISDGSLVPDGDLGRTRTRELGNAGRALGIAEVVVFDHPDGNVTWGRPDDLEAELALTIARFRADAVITFDDDGLYWHPDHIGVHEHTTAAVASRGQDAPALYYVTTPPGVMRAVVDAAHLDPRAPAELSLWGISPEAFGHAAKAPTFAVDVRDWIPRKLDALRCHRTQIGPGNPFTWIDDDSARRMLGTEYFRRAPIAGAHEPLLETLAISCA